MKEYYIVEFVDVKSPSILERIFDSKEKADVYKSEHELGKFAAVITTTHLNIYQIYLQEILNVLRAQPDKFNPLGFRGCVYEKNEPEPHESFHCVIGQHAVDHNIKLPDDNPTADDFYDLRFRDRIPDEILDDLEAAATSIQSYADGGDKEDIKQWNDVIPFVEQIMKGRN